MEDMVHVCYGTNEGLEVLQPRRKHLVHGIFLVVSFVEGLYQALTD